jgi:ABC-type transporter Mla maintaining outer membrane lipid asymmetry permease subunit MlaE
MVGFRVYAGLQFQSFIGSSLLVIVLITIFAGMICALYLRKPRLDYR